MEKAEPIVGDSAGGGDAECALCSAPCEKSCARCHEVYYCSKEHQATHWKLKHKLDCAPVKIVVDTQHPCPGARKRVLIATRDIQRGEIIFKERALLYGPREDDKARWRFPLCLNCCRLLPNGGYGSYCCSKCKWPVCGPSCEQGQIHSQFECPVFAKAKVVPASSVDEYFGILLLRAILLREKNPNFWEKIEQLNLRPDDMYDEEELVKMFCFLQHMLKSWEVPMDMGYEKFKMLCRAILQNRTSDEPIRIGDMSDIGEPNGSFVYFKSSFLSHSCVPNSQSFIQANCEVWLRASVPIKKDQLITVSFIDLDYCTLVRRDILDGDYGIQCFCPRCKDPTELGTFMGAIKCKVSGCPDYYLPLDPLDSKTTWACQAPNCSSTMKHKEVFDLHEEMSDEYGQIQKRSENARIDDFQAQIREMKEEEKYIRKYEGKIVHPNHFLLFVARKAFVLLTPRMLDFIQNDIERNEFVQRQVLWTRQCLELVDKFWPGLTRYRGQFLYCLQSGLLTLMVSEVEKYETGKRSRAFIQERASKFGEVFGELVKFRDEIKQIFAIEREGKFERSFLTQLEGEEFLFRMVENAAALLN